MNPRDQNYILTGMVLLGTKAAALVVEAESPAQQLHDALRLVQQAASESLLLETRPLIGAQSHSTKEALLANAIIHLFAAIQVNDMQVESAIMKQLVTMEARRAAANGDKDV